MSAFAILFVDGGDLVAGVSVPVALVAVGCLVADSGSVVLLVVGLLGAEQLVRLGLELLGVRSLLTDKVGLAEIMKKYITVMSDYVLRCIIIINADRR